MSEPTIYLIEEFERCYGTGGECFDDADDRLSVLMAFVAGAKAALCSLGRGVSPVVIRHEIEMFTATLRERLESQEQPQ